MQIDEQTGGLLHTYPVLEPATVVAANDLAFVLAGGAGNVQVKILELRDGVETTIGIISAGISSPGLALCGGDLFATTIADDGILQVSEVPVAGGAPQMLAPLAPAIGAPLACDGSTLMVAIRNADDGGIYRIAVSH
jgi:hypothetical protein